ncbi:MAG: hypothetical protein ABL891_08430 [Burkholderiales bacterium]
MAIAFGILATILGLMAFSIYRSLGEHRRAAFIREYVFPQGLLARLAEKRPQMTLKEQQLVLRGLRKFFLYNLMAEGKFVSMPSQAVDDLWHEFILFTKHYDGFCKKAFGYFLHHTPAVVLSSQKVADNGLRRTWWYACKDETINPRNPSRLPLLFALDGKLDLPDGFRYETNCNKRVTKYRKDGSTMPAAQCATDFGAGSSSDSSSTSSDGFGDLGFSSADSGSSDGGGSDGGGSSCGGGGCGGGGGGD